MDTLWRAFEPDTREADNIFKSSYPDQIIKDEPGTVSPRQPRAVCPTVNSNKRKHKSPDEKANVSRR